MRRLTMAICICCLFSCKKDAAKNITAYNWVLVSATTSPAKQFDGKLETDYMRMDRFTCLANKFTITFAANGTYGYSSTGPLCDLAANDGSLKWSQNGNQLILDNRGTTITATIKKKNALVYANTFNDVNSGQTYTVNYIYSAKSK